MATLDEIRAAEAELLSTLASLRTRVEQQNQAIVDLIARGNITPAEAEAINQRAAQTNQEIQTAQPVLRRILAPLEEGAGFFNRAEVSEIGTRVTAAAQSFGTLVDRARANREEMNQLAGTNQAATKAATDNKAAADQGTKTDSAGAEIISSGVSTQNPSADPEQIGEDGSISNAPSTLTPTNAVPSQTKIPVVSNPPPTIGNVTADAGGGLPGTPSTGTGALQQAVSSGASQFYVYKAVLVTSNFSGGKFTQDLEGVLIQFPITQTARQDGTLVPIASSTTVDSESGRNVIPENTNARVGILPANLPSTVGANTNNFGSDTGAQLPPSDSTIYGPAQNSPPSSNGGDPSVLPAPASLGEGSANSTTQVNLARES
jgi:hypothetical protein